MNPTGWHEAYLGSLAADALAMPAHWYYDREALRRDYGEMESFQAPRNPHPGSILWRSSYEAPNEKGDILREQAEFWGKPGIHYHQFLAAGENTLNFRLARALHDSVSEQRAYDPDLWLERYIDLMLRPGWHRDTYVEECHRGFFERYARGVKPRKCAISDGHIGGLAAVPALAAALAALGTEREEMREAVKTHVSLSHRHANVLRAADSLIRVLWALLEEEATLHDAIRAQAGDWLSGRKADSWLGLPDEEVVGRRFSPACYIEEAMPASLYLAWKYHDSFVEGIRVNAVVGGDNCHRGAVVGALLGAARGVPDGWRLA